MQLIKVVLFSFLLINTYIVSAQEQPTYASVADKRFEHFQYASAAPVYEKIAGNKKVKPQVLYRLAYSYNMMQQYQKALYWYNEYKKRDTGDHAIWMHIGDLYKTLQQYDSAKVAYSNYVRITGDATRVESKIAGCDSALLWIKHPLPIKLVNEQNLNTKLSDWGPALYNKKIVFTSEYMREDVLSSKEIGRDNYGRTGNPYIKLYMADPRWHDIRDSSWKNEVLITDFTKKVNTYKLHVAAAAFTKNFDTAYFTITHTGTGIEYVRTSSRHLVATRKLELYYTYKDRSGEWVTPVEFAYNNSRKYSVGAAALNHNGSILYFTSDMPGGIGKTDIWYSEKQADGTWGTPKNCGSGINTSEDEVFPTIGKNDTLYYSSAGLAGMGGLDLFITTGSKDKWSVPVNMKTPVNSSYDDFFLTVDGDGGYLSSNRPGGIGSDDIYAFHRLPVPVVEKPRVVVMLNTKVINASDGKVIRDAKVMLTNKDRNADWRNITGTAGNATFLLEANSHYNVTASADGFIADTVQFETVSFTKSDTVYKTLTLKTIPPPPVKESGYKVGDKFVLEDLYYDLDKSNIRPDAALVLDKLVVTLKKYPSLVIELSSHTDSRGSDAYNLALSQRRATSAVQYIVSQGISANRLRAKGYGETKLLNGCVNGVPCSAEQHQLNRRTEVTILKN